MLALGQDKLIDFLKEETGRSVSAIRRTLDEGGLLDEHRLLVACNQDESLQARLRPFAGLIRGDSFDQPLVVLSGSVFVTAGSTRRSTGAHYTPPSLTEPIVQHTLEPLVYVGPPEGLPREQWKLKSPKEILALKVCDMAMGSGAFLVQVCRYLAERLTEAWENEENLHPGEVLITPDGEFSTGNPSERLVPAEANERIAIARRVVADRCLYGVDINPMAVEMAKLSLWLITVDAHRPFTFLDHALKCGDSLLGIASLEQLENFSMRPGGGKQQAFSTLNLRRHIDEAKKKRELLESMPSDTAEQIVTKTALYAEAEVAVAKLNAAANVLVSVELKGSKGRAYDGEREASADYMMANWAKGLPELQSYARQCLGARVCFHWALVFPEVISRGGFSAVLGNPPFIGGKKISSTLGSNYQEALKGINSDSKGAADLCAYFFRRASDLLATNGCFGLIATDTIAQGDTREVGLDYLAATGSIYRATATTPWPGTANVHVAEVWYRKGRWDAPCILEDKETPSISSSLLLSAPNDKRFALLSNRGCISEGVKIHGNGFVISTDQYDELIAIDPRNSTVLSPYLGGDDICSSISNAPPRYVIDFGTRSLEDARKFHAPFAIVEKMVRPYRDSLTGQIHEHRFWIFWDRREKFFEEIQKRSHVFVCSGTAKYLIIERVSVNQVLSQKLKVFRFDSFSDFAVLQSTIHESWARFTSATRGEGLAYSNSDSFATFPRPIDTQKCLHIGVEYYEYRNALRLQKQESLTTLFNRLHTAADQGEDIEALRELSVRTDEAVALTYGWSDLKLNHDFHETKQGVRFTISEAARREVLDRLLILNHQRRAEEEAEAAALAAVTPIRRGRKPKDSGNQTTLDM